MGIMLSVAFILVILIVIVIFFPQIQNAFNNITFNIPITNAPAFVETDQNVPAGCVFTFTSESNEGGIISTYNCEGFNVYENIRNPQGEIVQRQSFTCFDVHNVSIYVREGVCPLFD